MNSRPEVSFERNLIEHDPKDKQLAIIMIFTLTVICATTILAVLTRGNAG